MGLQNEILAGRFNRFAQKLLAIKGSPPLPTLSSDVAVAITVRESGAENLFLQSWNHFAFAALFGAQGVGVVNRLQLRNPVGSNIITVVEKILVGQGSADGAASSSVVILGAQTAAGDFGVSQTAIPLDGRQGLTGSNTKLTSGAGGILGAGNILEWYAPAFTPIELLPDTQHEITIAPGFALFILAGTANIQNAWSVMFRERFLEDSERA